MTARYWPALLTALLLLVGCTTIPANSTPEVVRTLNRGASSPQASITPDPGEGPRDVVSKFISAGVLADAGHSSSRQFLTNAAARKWQDNPTVIVDSTTIGVASQDESGANLQVTGRRIGQVDQAGVYTPTLKGMGVGDPETFNFKLIKVAGQWRIDQLQPGVLIDKQAFLNSYLPATNLYFVNATYANTNTVTLVPDIRYTPLRGQALASWLLNQLLAGPRPELAQAVASELPNEVGKPSVQLGDPIDIEIPGATQLDEAGRNALAAQLAFTFATFEYSGAQLTVTDLGRPVRIPSANGATFSQDVFTTLSPDPPTATAYAYFIRNGAVISGEDNKPLPGLLGQPSRSFSSIAVRQDPTGGLKVAGVSGNVLQLGTDSKLAKVNLPAGALSRPVWRPHANDVWFGIGSSGAIDRVVPGQAPISVSITSPVGSAPAGRVIALQFSPDGVRLGAVVRNPDGTAAVWVGSVVTSGSDVRIVSFEPVTPAQLTVTDVAWSDSTELDLIATSPVANGGVPQLWTVHSDGSQINPVTDSGLPGAPTSVADVDNGPTLVSASGNIWAHSSPDAPAWVSYPGKVPTEGINPTYAQ